jgi:hypothetical protein
VGISHTRVHQILQAHNLKPHLVKRFRSSDDPAFEQKPEDIVGPYLNPPENAIVLSVDEESQVQALERARPICRSARAFPRGRRMTTSATESPICMQRSTWPPAKSSELLQPHRSFQVPGSRYEIILFTISAASSIAAFSNTLETGIGTSADVRCSGTFLRCCPNRTNV